MDKLFLILGVAIMGVILIISPTYTAVADEEREKQDEVDTLFLLEEAYTQAKKEVQLTPSVRFTRGRATELEINEDSEIEEKKKKVEKIRTPLQIEYGITDWLELSMELSTIYKRTDSTTFNNTNRDTKHIEDFEDMELGLRYLLVREDEQWPAASLEYAYIFPTGDSKEELGFENEGHEFSLAISRDFGRWVGHLNLEAGFHLNETKLNENGTRSKKIDLREVSYGLAAVYRINQHWKGFLELFHELEEEIQVNKRKSETELTILPGISYAFELGSKGKEKEWEFQLGMPLGITDDAPDWGVIFQLKYEFQL